MKFLGWHLSLFNLFYSTRDLRIIIKVYPNPNRLQYLAKIINCSSQILYTFDQSILIHSISSLSEWLNPSFCYLVKIKRTLCKMNRKKCKNKKYNNNFEGLKLSIVNYIVLYYK